jgi:hypothetical protein
MDEVNAFNNSTEGGLSQFTNAACRTGELELNNKVMNPIIVRPTRYSSDVVVFVVNSSSLLFILGAVDTVVVVVVVVVVDDDVFLNGDIVSVDILSVVVLEEASDDDDDRTILFVLILHALCPILLVVLPNTNLLFRCPLTNVPGIFFNWALLLGELRMNAFAFSLQRQTSKAFPTIDTVMDFMMMMAR